MAFCEGRLASGTPSWLVGCHTLSLAGVPGVASLAMSCSCGRPLCRIHKNTGLRNFFEQLLN